VRKWQWMIFVLWPLFSATAAVAQAVERFSLSGPRVAVFNLAGEMRVEAGSGSAVVVEVTRAGRDADELAVRTGDMADWRALRIIYPSNRLVYPRLGRMSRSQFDAERDGTFGSRILRATLDDDGFTFTNSVRGSGGREQIRVTGSGSGLQAWADLRVLVPAGQTVALHIGVGRISVSNVNGDVRVEARSGGVAAANVDGSLLIHTGSGSVTAADVTGHVRIDTGSGGVDVQQVNNGTVIVNTGSGSIDAGDLTVRALALETGSGGIDARDVDAPELKIETGSGTIRADLVRARDLDLSTGSGSITLGLLTDVRNARLHTGSGGITLGVPRNLGAELLVDTGSGGIDTEIPLQVTLKKKTSLRGRIGDGNGRIEIDTGSGGVRLRAN
jgi:lia operon protein LiaG